MVRPDPANPAEPAPPRNPGIRRPFSAAGASALLSRHLPLVAPGLLVLAICLAYAPSLPAGYLNWDDPWLVANNRLLATGGWDTLTTLFFDLSTRARLELGAEYLPFRDLSVWLDFRLFGPSPQAMRAMNLLLYISGVLLLRVVILGALGRRVGAELAIWGFALHPAHVDAVAWITGRKDVLLIVLTALALYVHASSWRWRRGLLALVVALACLSRSIALILPGLLWAFDLLARRRADRLAYSVATAVVLAIVAIQLPLASRLGMATEFLGGSRSTALMTMGSVWLRYAVASLWPPALSVIHDVPVLSSWTWSSAGGYGLWLGWAGWAAWRWWRAGKRSAWALLLCWSLPLIPVSQVLVAHQTPMADRYLTLSVLAPCLALSALAVHRRLGRPLAFAIVAGWALATAYRADLFASSSRLFEDATRKTVISPVAPFQWAMALEAEGRPGEAEAAYREVLRRAVGGDETGRRATNNLARLLVHRKNLDEAEALLREAAERWPHDPKLALNLIRVLVQQGHDAEARARYEQLLERRRRRGAPSPPQDAATSR